MTENMEIFELAQALGEALKKRGWRATAAESCTGGGIADAMTSVPGASEWFEGALVSYANRIKRDMLFVSEDDLETFGAVSEPVVRQMASGVLAMMDANVATAVSGIAGPEGGTEEKPVGTVWIAWAHSEGQEPVTIEARCYHFDGDRAAIRRQSVIAALRGMLELVRAHPE
ncbi:CinA family protein [Microbulbifer thermotolerans]|uniref:CinA family protein n=1 Tax=Microbulbifer thermotolerans TaxID=252514 RepID=A0A143HRN4_MICTH|nr:CinA family protein [Microbulbifer thermotolerans]AMX04176.1 damage-inducible protein CinA [Microbulbifer thermotolerans]MCX2780504.1 CinA family protein [Microbulbifer thermotolerans]MCX2784103.1 CinA family protein [Microbulbifer thermotolerans]MCX2794872.1 CinA family protein [Microbulbifer thermotolerans]MCX2803064.1 CinA family protein [Microbulbifer thermotolerans]